MSLRDNHVGQDSIQESLKRYIARGNLPNTFLFTGPRGSGKTYFARLFIKDFLCPSKKQEYACKTCISCTTYDAHSNPDFKEVNVDGNTIKINTIKEIQTYALLQPMYSQQKILLINDIHGLTPEASNALLKVLEEPNDSTCFILTTSYPDMVMKTISSRAIILRFKPYTTIEMEQILTNTTPCEDSNFIASISFGDCKRGLSLCNPEIFQKRNEVCNTFLTFLLNTSSVFHFSQKMSKEDIAFFIFEAQSILSDCILQLQGHSSFHNKDFQELLGGVVSNYTLQQCTSMLAILLQAEELLTTSTNEEKILQKIAFDCRALLC